MVAVPKIPCRLTLDEFLAWTPADNRMWQLVDGRPEAMAPASRTHSAIQNEIGRLIGNHLMERGSERSALGNPGVVPRVQSDMNFRIPDLAVTCSDYQAEEATITDPVLIVEILSPTNQAETWTNVWAYTTIPSVKEILVLHTTAIGADLLRRNPDRNWPERPVTLGPGEDLVLDSIGFRAPLAAAYATTRLATH